jgi:hypothetical protein
VVATVHLASVRVRKMLQLKLRMPLANAVKTATVNGKHFEVAGCTLDGIRYRP